MNNEKKHIGIKIFSILFIIIFILFLYGRYINPYSLTIKETPIYDKSLNKDYNGLKIVQFSDLHYGRTIDESKLKKITKEINKLNADILIFTGDLFDYTKIKEEDITLISKYLKKMQAKLTKLAIIGDYDQKYPSEYAEILNKSNFTLLDNTSKLIYYNSNSPLNFIGLTNTNNISALYDNNYYNITLVHKPDSVKKITNNKITFAGHSLGGQIKIPFIGGIIKKDGAKIYYADYYKLNNSKLYISNGLGTENYSFRFFNTPSITLYRLYNS